MEIQFHFYTEHTQKTGHKKLWSQLLKNLFECHTLFRENFNVCSNAFVSGFDLNWARTRQTRKFCNHKKFNVYTYRHTLKLTHTRTQWNQAKGFELRKIDFIYLGRLRNAIGHFPQGQKLERIWCDTSCIYFRCMEFFRSIFVDNVINNPQWGL